MQTEKTSWVRARPRAPLKVSRPAILRGVPTWGTNPEFQKPMLGGLYSICKGHPSVGKCLLGP